MKALGKKGTATRQIILESARRAFTESGYDVGVREIAEGAGVTAMLVNRYFGSKERLFEEVIDMVLATPGILKREIMKDAPDLATLCQELAVALVARTDPHTTPMDGFLIMLRSANNEQASSILRKKFEAHFAQPLAALLPGPGSAQRAAMLLAVIAGIQLMRQIVELAALTQAKPDDLAGRIETLFASLVKDVPAGNPQTRKSS